MRRMPAVLMRTSAGATGPAMKRFVSEPKSSMVCFDAPAVAMASRNSSEVDGSWTPGNPLLYRTRVRQRLAIRDLPRRRRSIEAQRRVEENRHRLPDIYKYQRLFSARSTWLQVGAHPFRILCQRNGRVR
jgi:hypothetical protein